MRTIFFSRKRKTKSGLLSFLWAENPYSVFVGSTPERLFAREYNLLLTEALAGTASVSESGRKKRNLKPIGC